MDFEFKAVMSALAQGGVNVVCPGALRCYSARSVAALLDVKPAWVREHREEFPGWFRLPGGGRNGGELRIPEKALNEFQKRGLSKI